MGFISRILKWSVCLLKMAFGENYANFQFKRVIKRDTNVLITDSPKGCGREPYIGSCRRGDRPLPTSLTENSRRVEID